MKPLCLASWSKSEPFIEGEPELLFKISYSGQLFGSPHARNASSYMILSRQYSSVSWCWVLWNYWAYYESEGSSTTSTQLHVAIRVMLLFSKAKQSQHRSSANFDHAEVLVAMHGERLGKEVLSEWFTSHCCLGTFWFRVYRTDTEQGLAQAACAQRFYFISFIINKQTKPPNNKKIPKTLTLIVTFSGLEWLPDSYRESSRTGQTDTVNWVVNFGPAAPFSHVEALCAKECHFWQGRCSHPAPRCELLSLHPPGPNFSASTT